MKILRCVDASRRFNGLIEILQTFAFSEWDVEWNSDYRRAETRRIVMKEGEREKLLTSSRWSRRVLASDVCERKHEVMKRFSFPFSISIDEFYDEFGICWVLFGKDGEKEKKNTNGDEFAQPKAERKIIHLWLTLKPLFMTISDSQHAKSWFVLTMEETTELGEKFIHPGDKKSAWALLESFRAKCAQHGVLKNICCNYYQRMEKKVQLLLPK